MNIAEQLQNHFKTSYKRFSSIVGTKLWDDIIKITSNDILLQCIIYANDVLAVPPIKTFLYMANLDNVIFEDRTKQCMGAVFGFIFYEGLGYSSKKNANCGVANVKKAAIFIRKTLDSHATS